MLLPDWEIRALCVEIEYRHYNSCRIMGEHRCRNIKSMEDIDDVFQPLLDPFSENVSGNGIVSYGLTHAGYDLRLANEIWIAKGTHGEIVEPRRMKEVGYQDKLYDKKQVHSEEGFIIPPHSYVLGRTLEYMRFPKHLKGRVVGKSTLARCGILINTTPMEPGWHGFLVVEIANVSPSPIRLYSLHGIAQLEIETLSNLPEKDYGDKGGIYQGQQGVTPSRVKE